VKALLFLQKKQPKNSYSLGVVAPQFSKPAISGSFLVVFFKKERLAFFGWDLGVTPGLLRFARNDECQHV